MVSRDQFHYLLVSVLISLLEIFLETDNFRPHCNGSHQILLLLFLAEDVLVIVGDKTAL